VAARSDLLRRQQALGVDSLQDSSGMTAARMGENPKGFFLLFISHIGSATGGLRSPRAAESAAAHDSSYSTSRRASPRGLGYFYLTTWEAASLKSISGHISSRRPFNSRGSTRLKARGLRATCPSVFSLRIFWDFLAKISDGPSARARGLRLGGYST
jgi:hypothetical protein